MLFRYVIVICVLLWIVYECTKSYWEEKLPSLWVVYKTPIKVGVGLVAILIILALPSLETLAANQNRGVYSTLRQLLVDDRHQHHFQYVQPTISENALQTRSHAPFAVDPYARAQFRDGVKLARGDANLPD